MKKVDIDQAWNILRFRRVKVLASSKSNIKEIKSILSVVGNDVVKEMRYQNTKYNDRHRIAWSGGYELYRDKVTSIHEDRGWLYVTCDDWTIVFGQ